MNGPEPEFKVTRGHLKDAFDRRQWDLLDKLLEIDGSRIDDPSLYTDTWGSWWGMLIEAVRIRSVEAVKVLLKNGARRDVASWGDGVPHTAKEAAEDQPEILALLNGLEPAVYTRTTDPVLPQRESPAARAVNRQGEINETSGVVFQTDVIDLS